jgi:hypothetical protein
MDKAEVEKRATVSLDKWLGVKELLQEARSTGGSAKNCGFCGINGEFTMCGSCEIHDTACFGESDHAGSYDAVRRAFIETERQIDRLISEMRRMKITGVLLTVEEFQTGEFSEETLVQEDKQEEGRGTNEPVDE